ncbi:MAG: phosphohistidine phosphatase SixA [Candidatus Eremiobacteraeota bacterium]|nr:phosphohistidine phosphatase SixA [Candidatus Eremiobacteraeota bacterium]
MKIYFLRHGEAGDRETWKGDDNERPLTDDGIERMKREAKAICNLDLDLDAIVTSPLVRAKQTAEIVAKALDLKDKLVEDPDVGLDLDVKRLQGVLTKFPKAEGIMLVGHDPSMSETIGRLIGDARVILKKGGMACVEVRDPASGRGELAWLVPPKMLAPKT